MLGFIKRLSREFRDLYFLKALHVSLVRSRLEYASILRCSHRSNRADSSKGLGGTPVLIPIVARSSIWTHFKRGVESFEPINSALHGFTVDFSDFDMSRNRFDSIKI
jgi:hypothetical protein